MLVNSDILLVQSSQKLAVKYIISPKGFQYDIFIVDSSNALYYHENGEYYRVVDNLPDHPNICITVDSDSDRNSVDNDDIYDIYYINHDNNIVMLRYNIKTKKLASCKSYTTTEPLQEIYPGNHGGCLCTTFDGRMTRAYELYSYTGLYPVSLFAVHGRYRKIVDGCNFFYLITDNNHLHRISYDKCRWQWDDDYESNHEPNDLELVLESVKDVIYLQSYGKYRNITFFVVNDNELWMASLHELNPAEGSAIKVKMQNGVKLYMIVDVSKFRTE